MLFLDTVIEQCLNDQGLGQVVNFLKTILTAIQIFIPIALIIIGSVDLGRAVMAGDEKQIKENQQRLLKRAIAAVIVFFVTAIITAVMGLAGGGEWRVCWDAENYKVDSGADTVEECKEASGTWADGVCYVRKN